VFRKEFKAHFLKIEVADWRTNLLSIFFNALFFNDFTSTQISVDQKLFKTVQILLQLFRTIQMFCIFLNLKKPLYLLRNQKLLKIKKKTDQIENLLMKIHPKAEHRINY